MMIMVLNSSVLVVHTQVPGYLTVKEAAQGLKTSSAGRTNHSKYEKRAICYDVCISVTWKWASDVNHTLFLRNRESDQEAITGPAKENQ